MEKEYFYIGHYIDQDDNYILKVGTTNDLERRTKEHTRNYKKSPHSPLKNNCEFHMDWFIPLSKYNTLRIEDRTRENLKQISIGQFIANDRFNCGKQAPSCIEVKIRKIYKIFL